MWFLKRKHYLKFLFEKIKTLENSSKNSRVKFMGFFSVLEVCGCWDEDDESMNGLRKIYTNSLWPSLKGNCLRFRSKGFGDRPLWTTKGDRLLCANTGVLRASGNFLTDFSIVKSFLSVDHHNFRINKI